MPTIITAPIKFSETCDKVATMQSALLLLLLGFADYEIPLAEVEEKHAGDGAVKGILILREKYPNEYNPELLVDELMATLINSLLVSLFTVTGRLTNYDRQGLTEHTVVIAEYDWMALPSFVKNNQC